MSERNGENDQSKAASFLPAILNSYVHPWYPTYVSYTTVHECASKFSTHHLHTTVSYFTVPDSTGITGSDSSATNFKTATVTYEIMVTTVPPHIAPQTATQSTALLPNVLTSTVNDVTLINSIAAIKFTANQPTVPPFTVMTTTSAVPTGGANPITFVTMTQHTPTKATFYPCKTMTLAMFYPYYSHPPHYAKESDKSNSIRTLIVHMK
jgi:hypothetical protein